MLLVLPLCVVFGTCVALIVASMLWIVAILSPLFLLNRGQTRPCMCSCTFATAPQCEAMATAHPALARALMSLSQESYAFLGVAK